MPLIRMPAWRVVCKRPVGGAEKSRIFETMLASRRRRLTEIAELVLPGAELNTTIMLRRYFALCRCEGHRKSSQISP